MGEQRRSSAQAPSLHSGGDVTIPDTPFRPEIYIRRADISASIHAYEKLLNASKAYTSTMLAMSKASSDLADAIQDCSHVKGVYTCNSTFQVACGLQFLKSNYEQVLCDTFYKEVSIPLLSQLDDYKATVHERQMLHETAVMDKTRLVKEIEAKHQQEGNRSKRDLSSYRSMLAELQETLNEVELIKAQHYSDVLEYEQQTWEYVASKIALLTRAQVDIADRIASKASTDPVLESITAAVPDPFSLYGPPRREDQLFTILQPSSFANSGLRVAADDPTSPARVPRRSLLETSRRAQESGSSGMATPTLSATDADADADAVPVHESLFGSLSSSAEMPEQQSDERILGAIPFGRSYSALFGLRAKKDKNSSRDANYEDVDQDGEANHDNTTIDANNQSRDGGNCDDTHNSDKAATHSFTKLSIDLDAALPA
ncbi:hypothetical protein MVES1_002840 [Malassezia vespertilionis]|uniref:Uncharacterized protein n=1 Tax=Malassezia vespertilionis TaxID=2020962 RepID=A0A2N1J9Y6_9BASI|nr:uncharacterized protein MVES1_002840 [Malassezia vespertilionis]PKI83371.1 hypothetical protein MVES_002685 [Malassezia vespertilionis]WFD07474.1 hypothetical protein MVES1_002840 [Malassezia vespertilionis]